MRNSSQPVTFSALVSRYRGKAKSPTRLPESPYGWIGEDSYLRDLQLLFDVCAGRVQLDDRTFLYFLKKSPRVLLEAPFVKKIEAWQQEGPRAARQRRKQVAEALFPLRRGRSAERPIPLAVLDFYDMTRRELALLKRTVRNLDARRTFRNRHARIRTLTDQYQSQGLNLLAAFGILPKLQDWTAEDLQSLEGDTPGRVALSWLARFFGVDESTIDKWRKRYKGAYGSPELHIESFVIDTKSS